MGVPRLFKYTVDTFPEAITHFRVGQFSTVVDYLYIDANSLLHQSAQVVYNYGQMERKINVYSSLTEGQKIRKVYDLFFQAILQITHIVSPAKVLYIAIDGTAPLSKQAQQRQRRFVASRNRTIEFDSNCLTPGTLFMHRLTRYMHYAIRLEMNSYPKWRDLQVYFSPATVPSEGEHKLLDFIRCLPEKERSLSSHCLFGPDGDLIMLTLATHIPNMYLFREDQYHPQHFHYLDMGKIREELAKQAPGRSVNDAVNDFIVEGFFVGNDFLPKIKMFYLLEDGIEMMLGTYKRMLQKEVAYLTKGGELSLSGFQKFVGELEAHEQDLLEEQAKRRVRDALFIDHTLLAHIKEKNLNMKSYRKSYYKKAIHQNFKEQDVKRMCHDYLKSFLWVLKYYVHGLPSWTWAYRWHYPPLLRDFSEYLKKLSPSTFKKIATFDMGVPSEPFLQLLSVLPPSSSGLLPKEYRGLMSRSGPLSKYYCEDFEIDYEGKMKEYQGVALLPFVDAHEIRKVYLCVPKRSHARNKRGHISLFEYDPTQKAHFASDMGSIPDLKVRKRELPPHRE